MSGVLQGKIMVLYILEDPKTRQITDPNSMKALSVAKYLPFCHVQNVNALPKESIPSWLNAVPTVVNLQSKDVYKGTAAINFLQDHLQRFSQQQQQQRPPQQQQQQQQQHQQYQRGGQREGFALQNPMGGGGGGAMNNPVTKASSLGMPPPNAGSLMPPPSRRPGQPGNSGYPPQQQYPQYPGQGGMGQGQQHGGGQVVQGGMMGQGTSGPITTVMQPQIPSGIPASHAMSEQNMPGQGEHIDSSLRPASGTGNYGCSLDMAFTSNENEVVTDERYTSGDRSMSDNDLQKYMRMREGGMAAPGGGNQSGLPPGGMPM